MAIGLQVWSKTAASNANADTNINWAEGMAPSQVNDSARAEMASAALWRDDNNGSVITSGSSAAFTATSNQIEAALTSGYTLAVQFHATPDSSATLNVDTLGAKPMQVIAGINLKGGEYRVGSITRFTYSTTGTGQWIANCAEIATPGVTDNSNANAGLVGEYQSTLLTSGSAVSLVTGTPTNITSISLTAGDWDLSGEIFFGGSGNLGSVRGAISQASGETTATGFTMPVDGYDFVRQVINDNPGSGAPYTLNGLRTRATSSSSVTYYLNVKADLTGTSLAYGALRARRMR